MPVIESFRLPDVVPFFIETEVLVYQQSSTEWKRDMWLCVVVQFKFSYGPNCQRAREVSGVLWCFVLLLNLTNSLPLNFVKRTFRVDEIQCHLCFRVRQLFLNSQKKRHIEELISRLASIEWLPCNFHTFLTEILHEFSIANCNKSDFYHLSPST